MPPKIKLEKLEKKQETSSPQRHEYGILLVREGKDDKKTGRAFFEQKGENWELVMHEHEKVMKKRDEYAHYHLTRLTLDAMLAEAKKLKLKKITFKKREGADELHALLADREFSDKGGLFVLDLNPGLFKRILKKLR